MSHSSTRAHNHSPSHTHKRGRRRKPRLRRRSLPGASPGTLAIDREAERPVIRVLAFDNQRIEEAPIQQVSEIHRYLDRFPVTWINVDGLGDAAILGQLGDLFKIHPLALEDVVNVHQRAKVEPYDEHLFVVVRMVGHREHHESEQVSIFLGDRYVLTFQERAGDCFDPVRDRIRNSVGRMRRSGCDYLAYTLIDAAIDSFFPVVESFADRLEDLEMDVAAHLRRSITARMHDVRNELLLLRRAIRPHREALNQLIRDEHPLITQETRVFLRDCYDHTIQLNDLLEIYREMCADLRDFFMTAVNNRMNEVMKILTIISTIFIPLSFVTGLYGMNFNTDYPWNMPELNFRYGYPLVLAAMATISLGLVTFIWRKGWFRSEI